MNNKHTYNHDHKHTPVSWLAAVLMSVSTVIVAFNAVLLRRQKNLT